MNTLLHALPTVNLDAPPADPGPTGPTGPTGPDARWAAENLNHGDWHALDEISPAEDGIPASTLAMLDLLDDPAYQAANLWEDEAARCGFAPGL